MLWTSDKETCAIFKQKSHYMFHSFRLKFQVFCYINRKGFSVIHIFFKTGKQCSVVTEDTMEETLLCHAMNVYVRRLCVNGIRWTCTVKYNHAGLSYYLKPATCLTVVCGVCVCVCGQWNRRLGLSDTY